MKDGYALNVTVTKSVTNMFPICPTSYHTQLVQNQEVIVNLSHTRYAGCGSLFLDDANSKV